jgi:hypothetical protein
MPDDAVPRVVAAIGRSGFTYFSGYCLPECRSVRHFLVVLVLLVCGAPAVADELRLTADPRGRPGGSQVEPLIYPDGALTVTLNPNTGILHVMSPAAANPNWSVDLHGIDQQPIQAMCYERAQVAGFQEARRPGFRFGFNGQGCNKLHARYRVLELSRDVDGVPTSLAVDFVQHCEQEGPAVYGQLRWRSDIPTSAGMPLDPVITVAGTWGYTAERGAPGWDFQADEDSTTRLVTFDAKFISVQPRFNNSVAFSLHGPVPGSQNGVLGTLAFAAADDAPLVAASYTGATEYPSHARGTPGFTFPYNGSSCSNGGLSANFTIARAMYDPLDRFPIDFSADYDERCGFTAIRPLVVGTLDYRASAYTPILDPELVYRGGFEEDEPSASFARSCTR